MSAPPDLSQWDDLSDEELEAIAGQAGADAEDEFADLSDAELEAIAGEAPAAPKRDIPRPSQILSSGMRHAEESRAAGLKPSRTALEIGAGIATIPLTGGLGLLGRMAASGAAGAGASLASETFDPTPGGIMEKVKRAAVSAGLNAGGEGIGSLIGAGFGRLARGLFAADDPARVVAQDAIEAQGGALPIAQASGRRSARVLQGIGESSFFGAGSIQDATEGAVKAAIDPIEDAVQALKGSQTREQLGRTVKSAIEGRLDAFRAATDSAYQAVDAAAQGATVSHQAIKAEAARVLKASRRLSPQSRSLLEQITRDPDALSFADAQQIRSALLQTARSSDEPIKGQAQGLGKRFASLMDDAMEQAARAHGGGLREAFRRANKLWKAGKDRFNSKLIAGLGKSSASDVVSAIGLAQDPTSIRTIRRTVKDPKLWREVQGEWLSGLLQESAEKSVGNQIKGQNLLNRLQKMGDPALKELLGAQQAATFKRMAKTLSIAQEYTGKGAGGINIRGAPEGTALSAIYLTGNPAAALISLTPAALARVVSNPSAVRLLTRGFQAPAGSEAASRAFGQLSQLVTRLGLAERGEEAQEAP